MLSDNQNPNRLAIGLTLPLNVICTWHAYCVAGAASEPGLFICSLTDPPQGNTTLHLRINIINQRGNAIDITPHVLLGPRERYFTAADFGVQFTTFVNLTGLSSAYPSSAALGLMLSNALQASGLGATEVS